MPRTAGGQPAATPPPGSSAPPGSTGGSPPGRRAAQRARPTADQAGGEGELTPEEQAELEGRLEELQRQLLDTPAEIVVANHAYGLFELAAIHLSQGPARLDQARLAVDAMGALVEGLAGRLGAAEPSLRDALAQVRLAFVQIGGQAGAPEGRSVDGDG